MTDFRHLAQLSSDALLVVAGGAVTYANPAAQALLGGVGRHELVGTPVHRLWQPNPLDDPQCWHTDGRLLPCCVTLQGQGHTLALQATRVATAQGWCCHVRAAPQAPDGPHSLAARLRTALELSTDAAMVVDARSLAFLDANEAACAMLGMSLPEVRARGPATMRRRDGTGAEDFHALYAQLIERSPQALTHEYDFLAEDGRVIPVAATRQALNLDGRWLIFITWRDISAQVSAQALVQQFKDAFDQTPDATNIIDVQTLGYVYVNEPFLRLVGLPRERVMSGGPLSMPRDLVVVDGLQAFLQSVVASHPHAQVRESTVTLPDGRQASFESRHQAIHSGGRWLVRCTRVDVTRRKHQQHHLARITAAFDASGDAIYIIDPRTFAYVDVNEAAARLHGVSRETLRTLGVRGAFPDRFDDAGLRARYDELIARHPQAVTEERQIPRADGRLVWAESIRRAVQVDGEWLVISVMRDITERKAVQARLELMHQAINAAPDAIVVIDPVTLEYVDVNEATAQMYCTTREQLLARGARQGLRGDASDEQMRQFYAGIVARSPEACTEEVPTQLGGRDVVLEFTRRAVNVNGRWLIVSVNRDITERKAAEAGLRQLKAVVDVAPDGMYIVDAASGEYVDLNHAAGQLYGLSREQVLQMGMANFMDWLNAHDPAFTLESVRERHAWLIEHHPQVQASERRVRLPGRPEIVTETLRQAVQVGGRWLILIVVRDITERRRAEDEIRRRVAELELLREAYDAAVDAILIADPETLAYYDVNQAAVQLLGVSREALLAGGVEASYYSTANEPFDAQRLRKGYRYVISRAPDAVIDVRTINPLGLGGRDTVIEFSRRGVNVQGRWVVVTLMRDITAQRRAEEEIRQRVAELTRSNQELEQFAYVTSHDLSEPLRMVASYTQLLSRRYADKFDDDGREFIKYAVDGAQRMKQLIDDLLMYSRAGRSRAPMRLMRLDRALDDALANLAHAVGRNGATIERGPMPELVCEKAGLTQVFQNLVGNAIKFRGEAAPVVRISAAQDEHFWTISVADNGIGIAPEYFQRIFIIFQRLHSRTRYEGTGIGLSICKKIVERHGGQITVASEPGQGTTFSFTLSRSLTESEPT